MRADRARLQSELVRERAELEKARRPWWFRLGAADQPFFRKPPYDVDRGLRHHLRIWITGSIGTVLMRTLHLSAPEAPTRHQLIQMWDREMRWKLGSFWRWLRTPGKRTVLGWLGGGLVVLAGGLLAVFILVTADAPVERPAQPIEEPTIEEPTRPPPATYRRPPVLHNVSPPTFSFSELDEALKKLVDANIAFQAPTKMKLSQAERVSVSLGFSQSRQDLEMVVSNLIRTGAVQFAIESSIIKVALVGFRGDGERAQVTSASIKEPSNAFPRLRAL
jgi:hypothetical protein